MNRLPSNDDVFLGRFTHGLNAGLGNKLFVIATGYAHAKRRNAEVFVADLKGWGRNSFLNAGHEDHHSDAGPDRLSEVYPNVNFVAEEVVDKFRNYDVTESGAWSLEDLSYGTGTALVGYFIRYEYFDEFRANLKTLFEPSETVRHLVERHALIDVAPSSIAVHVRRTDKQKFETELGDDYLDAALSHFPSGQPVLFFSDDIAHCKTVLAKRPAFRNRRVFFSEGCRNYVDLELMRLCEGHVIQFSTLGWWGAYLASSYPDTVVVRPETFARIGPPHWISE